MDLITKIKNKIYRGEKKKSILFPILLISLFLWFFYFYYYSSILIEAGGMEYAQIAYNLYKGNGFKTDIILPFRLNYQSYDYPFKYGILHPLIICLFFKIFGVSDLSVVLSSGIFYFFIIIILFIFTKKIFSEDVAMLSILLFAFNPVTLEWTMWGTPDPLFIFLIMLSLIFLVKNKNPAFAGFIFSISQITRLHSYFYLPGIIMFIIFLYPKEKFKNLLKFIIGTVPLTSVFLFYQYLNAGILFPKFAGNYLAVFTPAYPGPQSLRSLEIIPFFEFIIYHPLQIIAKIKVGLYNFINFFPLITNPYLMAFFFSGLFFGYKNSKEKKYKFLIIFFIFSVIFFYLISIGYIERYILTILPFIIIISSQFILSIFDTFAINSNNFKRKLFLVLFFCFLLVFPLFFDIYSLIFDKKGIGEIKKLYRTISKISQNNFKKDAVILSDSPWPVAWYGKRKCIWLPLSPDDIKKIERKIKVDGIILTSLYVAQTELDTPSLWLAKFTEPKGKSNWKDVFEGKRKLENFGKRNFVKAGEFFIVYFNKNGKN